MQFASFALVCVVALQVVFVSAYPAAGGQGEKTIEQLHEEYNNAGAQLQADLKKAHAREDFKGDVHVQAVLNGYEEVDKKAAQWGKNAMDPNHPLSRSEILMLNNDIHTWSDKTRLELRLLKPEQRQDQLIMQIGLDITKRGRLLGKIVLKQLPNMDY